jgi:hypothetical protein
VISRPLPATAGRVENRHAERAPAIGRGRIQYAISNIIARPTGSDGSRSRPNLNPVSPRRHKAGAVNSSTRSTQQVLRNWLPQRRRRRTSARRSTASARPCGISRTRTFSAACTRWPKGVRSSQKASASWLSDLNLPDATTEILFVDRAWGAAMNAERAERNGNRRSRCGKGCEASTAR